MVSIIQRTIFASGLAGVRDVRKLEFTTRSLSNIHIITGHSESILTQLRVREEPKGAALRSALDEADAVDPELHVLGQRPRVGVEEEGEEDAGVWRVVVSDEWRGERM